MEVGHQYEKVPMFLTLLCPLTFGLEMKLGLGGSVPKDGAIGFFFGSTSYKMYPHITSSPYPASLLLTLCSCFLGLHFLLK